MGRAPDARQYALDFSSAAAERNFLLETAVRRLRGAKLHHLELARWFGSLQGNRDEPVKRTLAEIAHRLFVSANKARQVAQQLADWGLLEIREETYATRGQAENSYLVRWERVRALITGAASEDSMTCDQHPPGAPLHGLEAPLQILEGPLHGLERHKELSALGLHLQNSPPPPPPVALGSPGLAAPPDEAAEAEASEISTAAGDARLGTLTTPCVVAPGWPAADSALRATGMYAADTAIASAQRRGLLPEQVHEAIAYWRAHAPPWGLGALFRALQRLRPEDRADEPSCWPALPHDTAATDEQAAANRAARDVARERLLERERQRERTAREEAAATEARWGPSLDGLDERALEALIARTPGLASEFFQRSLRQRPLPPLVRGLLLEQLRAEDG